ncbi:MAG TPA: hypothetical protein VFZ65_03100 [Planctomycetota bacterium]|nr:hypothetical protein [Planctomycetota bacterium]
MLRRSRFVLGACLTAAVAAQAPPAPKTEEELDKQVIQTLVGFARSAENWKTPSRARAVYEQILAHYDLDNASARAGLGWKKVKDEWQVATPSDRLPKDTATPAQQEQVANAWRQASKRVAKLHKDFGLALDGEGHRARAVHHFERALAFDEDDVDCHRALGHEEFDGFFGSPEQITFVKRLREILGKAREIAAREIEVAPVAIDQMPVELQRTGFPFVGARSRFTTYWVHGSAEEAAQCAIWNERAVLLLQYLFGDDPERNRYLVPSRVRWIGVLRSAAERARLLEVSPEARANETLERAQLFASSVFTSHSGKAEWTWHNEHDDDHVVGQATQRGTPWFNPGLSEGLVHTMTWLLCGTLYSSYMMLPTTQATSTERPRKPSEWLRALRAEIDRGDDHPLVQVPREQLANFRDAVRFKSWSFVTWLLARHPDRWVELMVELGHEKRLPEEVAEIFKRVLGRDVGDVEAEWRDWARAGSRIGKASGLPQ